MQNDVENTAGFTSLDHIGREIVKDNGILAHGVGQRGAAFHRGPHPSQNLLERLIFLVRGQDFQTLHQRQPGIDHDRELAKEDRNVLGLNLARAERGHGKFFAFFANGTGRDALAPQRLRQRLLVGCHPLAGYFLPGCVLAGKCEDWHVLASPR